MHLSRQGLALAERRVLGRAVARKGAVDEVPRRDLLDLHCRLEPGPALASASSSLLSLQVLEGP